MCVSFVKRAKDLIAEDFFVEELRKALKVYDRDLDYDANGEVFFKKIERPKLPSHQELMDCWKEHHTEEQS